MNNKFRLDSVTNSAATWLSILEKKYGIFGLFLDFFIIVVILNYRYKFLTTCFWALTGGSNQAFIMHIKSNINYKSNIIEYNYDINTFFKILINKHFNGLMQYLNIHYFIFIFFVLVLKSYLLSSRQVVLYNM